MKFISILITAFVFATSVAASANANADRSSYVQKLVDQYYAKKESTRSKNSRFFDSSSAGRLSCLPTSGQSCMDAACDRLGEFGCNEMSEIQEVGRACRGNYDGDCLSAVCDKLGAFGCNEMSEIQTVGKACIGNYGMDCFDSVCKRLGAFGCNELSEIESVLKACGGT